MEVKIKNQIISRASISSISYNHQFGLLAVVADGNDTATFFSLSNQFGLIPRFSGESKPPSSGLVTWSPNGLYIIVANIKVQLWKFEGSRMAPIRIVNQGFIQIKGVAWSEDSQYYLCYGITPKDTPLSINIRNIQTNQLRQIVVHDPVIIANFDPFGKYVAALMLKNVLDLYDSRTLEKVKSINLADTKNDIPTLRDKRMADWSPEFSYFACPNLNDSRIPTALILDRNKNFITKDILLGHQASISCTKFNPHIYQFQSEPTFILAVGDSSGCLSLWRIGRTNSYKQPIFILSSPTTAQQSIQGIQWNQQGQMLFVNVLKKYIILIGVNTQQFGRRLTLQQKNNIIIATYGASGVTQITSTKLQVFGQSELNSHKIDLQIAEPAKIVHQASFQPEKNKQKQVMIATKQQQIKYKDANNRQKKRIIPSRMVPQSQVTTQKQSQISAINQKFDSVVQMQGSTVIIQKSKTMNLRIPTLRQQIRKQYYLPNQQFLQIQSSKNIYIVTIREKNNICTGKYNQSKRFFNGQIKLLTVTRQNIFIVNNQKLFIFDLDLKLVELPCYIGDISSFAINNSGTIFYMLTNGLIRGINFLRHQFILETSIQYLFMSSDPNQIKENPFILFQVFDQDNDRLHVQLKSNLNRYFFCKQTNSWVQFNFQQGFYLPGHSLRITKADNTIAKNFYKNIVSPAVAVIQNNSKNQPTVSLFQLQLIYYRKYVKDIQKFKDSLVRMISDLKVKESDQQLRKIIIKYFIDRDSDSYINDNDLWEKVKKIGGKVIQEFLMLQKI